MTMNGTDVFATQAEYWVDRSTVYRQYPSHGLRTRNIHTKQNTNSLVCCGAPIHSFCALPARIVSTGRRTAVPHEPPGNEGRGSLRPIELLKMHCVMSVYTRSK